ncbi:YggS family pyridoxal phosphate-dependent enzyme [Thiohalophilus sp.]|uniref:YggS family pyridoxal phosphate-dependent enzyme n=1 Tax=Thiohalophilus sp. TaxID=3028392 RepID=UPI002ACE8F36|nr:YggS family pyridoxal phosphate-dependent enzyme [Thiohalophilus sp.]MDZ7804809.1 YggS family pyridoxal phosphate-dependent enzyme [Thiohalophilus sp.]
MNSIAQRLETVRARITQAEQQAGRAPGSVRLLAVSKTRPIDDLRAALVAGQTCFGENYLQDALPKIAALADEPIEWHYIGPIQSNKTREIAEHFAWVHSVDRLKIARRLGEQRPAHLPPLNLCLQINTSGEASKSGIAPDEALELARALADLPHLQLRGLMTIPAPAEDFEQQRMPFRRLRELYDQLNGQGLALDTLSMGMTGDMEAAIAEGSTMVRIGTAIFGARAPNKGRGTRDE